MKHFYPTDEKGEGDNLLLSLQVPIKPNPVKHEVLKIMPKEPVFANTLSMAKFLGILFATPTTA